MKQSDPHKVTEEIKTLAKKHGLWLDIVEQYKPDLKCVVFTLSFKVNKKETNP